MISLEWSTQNKVPENRQVNIKLYNKKCPAEKTQTDQNATANEIEKIKRARRVKLHEP